MHRKILAILAAAAMCGAMSSPHAGSQEGDAVAAPVPARAEATLQKVQLICSDDSFGWGLCPSPKEQCRQDCYEGYEDDTLRCLAGASGILPPQRAACHAKAAGVYGYCLTTCEGL